MADALPDLLGEIRVYALHGVEGDLAVIDKFKVLARDDEVGVHVVTELPCHSLKPDIHGRSLGSVISPVTADAAATAGEAR